MKRFSLSDVRHLVIMAISNGYAACAVGKTLEQVQSEVDGWFDDAIKARRAKTIHNKPVTRSTRNSS